ncbi:MAG TPA: 3-deoxy-D-manno-octulosonic acid transferase [Armatimonadetes bacterium]|nr:3-deoxy-D-manno-octulosonic acid transferase [Armatimonadota bacterium]
MTPAYVLYNLFFLSLLPVPFFYYLLRMLRRGRLRKGWGERLGFVPSPVRELCRTGPVLWVHAVSVGEVLAALPILRELRRLNPGARVVLSTVTETGRAVAAQRAMEADALIYLPLDVPFAVERTLRALRPQLLATVDTELWPNLFTAAHAHGAVTATVNGRISDESFALIRRFHLEPLLFRWWLPTVDRLCMQSPVDAERICHLGAPADKVVVTGSAKFDEEHPQVTSTQRQQLQLALGLDPKAPVLLAGSTGEGEEKLVLAAFRQIRTEFPTARLLLVPRHIDRTPAIEAEVRASGLIPQRRTRLPTEAEACQREERVIIVDTLGELARLYALATVAFVGRSLVPQGGSNLLQAAAQGKPVVFGPHVTNFRDSAALLEREKVGFRVATAEELAATVRELWRDSVRLEKTGRRAREVVLANRGAARRTAEILTGLLRQKHNAGGSRRPI